MIKNVIIICSVLMTINVAAQSSEKTHSETNKEFTFDGKSSQEVVAIEVNNVSKEIGFQLQGEIEQGELEVRIFDPNGKKEGGFELLSRKSNSKNSNSNSNSNSNDSSSYSYSYTTSTAGKAHGSMTKHLGNPVSGTWKIRITAKSVKGKLAIKVSQVGG